MVKIDRLAELFRLEDPDAIAREKIDSLRREATEKASAWLQNPVQANQHRIGQVREDGIKVTFSRNGIQKVEIERE